MNYGTDITRPEAESSWRASSGRPARTRGCRIPFGGKMARRCRITLTFITLMGEHVSCSSTTGGRLRRGALPETNVRSRLDVHARVCALQRHCLFANTRRSSSHPLATPTALPSKPGGHTRWQAIVRFVPTQPPAIDLPRDSYTTFALKIYLSFASTELEQSSREFYHSRAERQTLAGLKFDWISIQRLFMPALYARLRGILLSSNSLFNVRKSVALGISWNIYISPRFRCM